MSGALGSVGRALGRAASDLFSVSVLWIVVWPFLAAGALWLVLGIVFWGDLGTWFTALLERIGLGDWLNGIEPAWIGHALHAILNLLLFVPLVSLTALLLTAIFGMPALVERVAKRDYPHLERRRGGGLVGSLVNAVVALALFVALWAASIPLWLIGVGAIVPFVAAAWLNQRLFRFDAVGEHADGDEMRALFAEQRNGWWGLGLITGLLQFVPLLNLLGPVYAALAFTHFGLEQLDRRRQAASLPTAGSR